MCAIREQKLGSAIAQQVTLIDAITIKSVQRKYATPENESDGIVHLAAI